MFSELQKAMMLGAVRWAMGAFGASIALFCFSHTAIMSWVQQACALMTNEQAMEAGLPAFAVAVAGLAWSFKDKVGVGNKLTVAAVTGSVEAADDPATRSATITAVKAGVIPVPDGVAPDIAKLISAHRAAGGKGG